MKNILIVSALGLLSAVSVTAQPASAPSRSTRSPSPPLVVVEDRGGVSALPYYQALNPQDAGPGQPQASPPVPAPRIGTPAEAEAAMLPVRSLRLSPGDEPRRVIRAPGLTPLFLIGEDDRSRAWLRQRRTALQELRAVGLVVSVATPQGLAALRGLAPGLVLSPVSGDDLAQRLGIRHYPVLITATGIEP
jgi:integrating conjugative element protein (TIGR03765 family)